MALKLSELKEGQDYTTKGVVSSGNKTNQGAIKNTGIAPIDFLANTGVGLGTAIGKAGLGLGELTLKGVAKGAETVGLDKVAQFSRKAAEITRKTGEEIYDKPFKQELETGGGQFGNILGVGATFLAPSSQIVKGQKIMSALSQPIAGAVSKIPLVGGLARGAINIGARAIPEAVGSGLTELARTGGDAESAKTTGLLAGGITAGLGVLGGLARKTFWPELQSSVTKALGIGGKTTGGRVMPQIQDKVHGLAVLKKYAPEVKVRTVDGLEKAFNPAEATFDETIQAWNQARKNIYNKYATISEKAGESVSIQLDDIVDGLSEIATQPRTAAYKEASKQILKDIVDNFGIVDDASGTVTFKPVKPKDLEIFLSDLYGSAAQTFAGKSDKAFGEIAAGTAGKIRTLLDDTIQGASGKSEYSVLKGEYGALKSIEQDLIKRFHQEARKLGGGLSDYANIFNSGDIIAGLLSQQPAILAKGLTQAWYTSLLTALKRPERYLQRAFKLIDSSGVDDITARLFGSPQKLNPQMEEFLKSRLQRTGQIGAKSSASIKPPKNTPPAISNSNIDGILQPKK